MSSNAITNRSIRTIKAELEFLADCSLINPSDLSAILALLPSPSSTNVVNATTSPAPPTAALASTTLSEKQTNPYTNSVTPSPNPAPYPVPPPPTYTPHASPSLAMASALYAYNPTDEGDLALLPNDRIQITEYMNADWAKGRNERTKQEGIFPRSYVNIIEERNQPITGMPAPTQQESANNYGNMPLAVSQSGGSGEAAGSKFDANGNGKKFGKKLGNAAIFGAGATIGGKIVNGIF